MKRRVIVQQQGVTITRLKLYSCRFIISEVDGVRTRYCGENARQTPYCDHHRKICYVPIVRSVRMREDEKGE